MVEPLTSANPPAQDIAERAEALQRQAETIAREISATVDAQLARAVQVFAAALSAGPRRTTPLTLRSAARRAPRRRERRVSQRRVSRARPARLGHEYASLSRP